MLWTKTLILTPKCGLAAENVLILYFLVILHIISSSFLPSICFSVPNASKTRLPSKHVPIKYPPFFKLSDTFCKKFSNFFLVSKK